MSPPIGSSALLLGLLGEDPETVDVDLALSVLDRTRESGTLALGGYAEFETLELRGATTLTGAGAFDTVAFNTAALTVAGGASLTTGALNGDATANLLTVNGTVTGAISVANAPPTMASCARVRLARA